MTRQPIRIIRMPISLDGVSAAAIADGELDPDVSYISTAAVTIDPAYILNVDWHVAQGWVTVTYWVHTDGSWK